MKRQRARYPLYLLPIRVFAMHPSTRVEPPIRYLNEKVGIVWDIAGRKKNSLGPITRRMRMLLIRKPIALENDDTFEFTLYTYWNL